MANCTHVKALESAEIHIADGRLDDEHRYIHCSFDGSLLGGRGSFGWVIYAGPNPETWHRIATGTGPVRNALSSTASEAVAATSLLAFLKCWLADKRSLAEAAALMQQRLSNLSLPS